MRKEITGAIEWIRIKYTSTGDTLFRMVICGQHIVAHKELAERCIKVLSLKQGDVVKLSGYEQTEPLKLLSEELATRAVIVVEKIEKVEKTDKSEEVNSYYCFLCGHPLEWVKTDLYVCKGCKAYMDDCVDDNGRQCMSIVDSTGNTYDI